MSRLLAQAFRWLTLGLLSGLFVVAVDEMNWRRMVRDVRRQW